jgi:membrane fusion protein, multidrug efflux system
MSGPTILAALTLAMVLAGAPIARADAPASRITARLQPVDDLKAVFATVESVDQAMARTRIGGTIADLRVEEAMGPRSPCRSAA